MIRPGGFELTERALSLAKFRPGGILYDIGCGSGETVRFLREKGYEARGIDPALPDAGTAAESRSSCGEYLMKADAARMPYADAAADGLLFECSFTKMKEPEKALKEAFRVLKPEGRLVVADMVARKEEAVFDGYLGRLETEEHLTARLTSAGFQVLFQEEYDASVRVFSGNLILEKGSAEAERLLGGTLREIRKSSPGYLLLILGKSENIRSAADIKPENISSSAE